MGQVMSSHHSDQMSHYVETGEVVPQMTLRGSNFDLEAQKYLNKDAFQSQKPGFKEKKMEANPTH